MLDILFCNFERPHPNIPYDSLRKKHQVFFANLRRHKTASVIILDPWKGQAHVQKKNMDLNLGLEIHGLFKVIRGTYAFVEISHKEFNIEKAFLTTLVNRANMEVTN